MDVFRMTAFALALMVTGCQTTEIWRGPQAEYVRIVPSTPDEDVEVGLKSSGRKYHCAQRYRNDRDTDKVCYAKVTPMEIAKNVAIKLQRTPEALAMDTGKTIYVVGYTLLDGLCKAGYHN
ncbi:hypothetical protein E8F20_23810 [Pseudomonas sp. BN415]|uniref:hypothetical protein n=1 Tax=Pseudomonas sp. BN415 TaxID=2567889 RepID=UPI002453E00D|nr:hypothetical protein [Pseudomonas sp. BN415]MDH4584894.1 hypothetical protein [Pseudomonas sp. BN415]